ncbi:SWM histone demethylase complex-like protein [Thermochaetoides thermophila DSM 1495]|uniref:SWM histone demethylase complex-like protein n=1 Tax=Chaetomium thermophilum (strain DSM 1495 / CBS 144.50 / IMI 039719) TaxID=759272 RepID=G0SCM4_CHATD|nr:SWM histone demethylase complex-like protein [Thermochaetoides thermophila DSM 1495]EGS19150.1 SWM histone demethylase complex-like protein [Thermochaetoides thermophila DSM 1495]
MRTSGVAAASSTSSSSSSPAALGKQPVSSSTATCVSPVSSPSDDTESPLPSKSSAAPTTALSQRESTNNSEEIAPEIVVWTGQMDSMIVDSPETATPVSPSSGPAAASEEKSVDAIPTSPSQPTSAPQLSSTLTVPQQGETSEEKRPSVTSSSLSTLSDQSDLSSVPLSVSSKATTPVDTDSSREAPAPGAPRLTQRATSPRRKWDVRPKVSIPPDLTLSEYALQCVAAAEASRLNPYALHQEEYLMLRDHISHAQVTTYLNIRNGILRLWVCNPRIAVTREEAVGCAKDPRWFDVASVCYDWLVRRGYINFGCVEIRPSRHKHAENSELLTKTKEKKKRRTVVVIGAGMAGLGCARQLEGLFAQYANRFRKMGEEPPEVIVLEARNRVGGRVYSRPFHTRPKHIPEHFKGKRFTAEMGGMIITGFERGNPINILLRAQLGLSYHYLKPETILYDSNGKPVDLHRDQLVENLYNDCLDRVSEYKYKPPATKLIEGNKDLIDEGRDSSAETHKTIRQAEEAAAAQPHAAPVSEQNMAPQVNLVPVSSDRATGRIHNEPGTPAALNAARKAKLMGWTLKQGVSEDADIDLQAAAIEPGATLGSVTDKVIMQYKDILDLTAQDFRLMNWHIANLEYSNATNYHQLSLPGWDIDAGNEWEGSHSMVIGGYQSVPRGLLMIPTPLNLRQKSPVCKITYTSSSPTGPAIVECEDGYKVEADCVVNTIPLGVLKHGSVKFEPPLPQWKAEAIERLGFGVLNKVILVYKEPFWDENRDIFGVLRNPPNRHSTDQKDYASQRGRFFQWFNVSKSSGLPVLIALMAGDAGYDTEQTCNDDLIAEATDILRRVYGSRVPYPVEAVITRWASDKFARGSYSSAGPDMKADDYDTMARPVGNLYFAVLDALIGPIPVPTPLILPKDLKRKAPSSSSISSPADIYQARLRTHEALLHEHLVSRLGPCPTLPPKPPTNAYMYYSKAHYDEARRRLEAGRRPGKGKPSANEVRVMSSKMWRDASDEDKKPYVEMAEEAKRKWNETVEKWRKDVEEWEAKAEKERQEWEKTNPPPPQPSKTEEMLGEGRRTKMRVVEGMYKEESESEGFGGGTGSGSDVEMGGAWG